MSIASDIREIESRGNARYDYSEKEQMVITVGIMSLLILLFMSA
jgi:hypothetical protein